MLDEVVLIHAFVVGDLFGVVFDQLGRLLCGVLVVALFFGTSKGRTFEIQIKKNGKSFDLDDWLEDEAEEFVDDQR